jgi:hypothetical protein
MVLGALFGYAGGGEQLPFFAPAGSATYTRYTGLAGCDGVGKALDAHARTVKGFGICSAKDGDGWVLNKSGRTP